MEKTLHLEETMTKIRHICNVENMSDVIDLYKKREENNELLAERLRDLNKEAETLVDKIEHHHQALRTLDDRAAEFESTAERKMMMLLVRKNTVENCCLLYLVFSPHSLTQQLHLRKSIPYQTLLKHKDEIFYYHSIELIIMLF